MRIGLSQQTIKLVFVEQSLASPYGRGAPNGGGEGPLSHGCAVTAPPKGEPRSLRDKHQFVGAGVVEGPEKNRRPVSGGGCIYGGNYSRVAKCLMVRHI